MFWNADPRTSPRFSSSLMNINGSDESDDDSIADKNYLLSNTSSCSDESENDSSKVSQGCKNNASLSKSANSSVNISGVLNISDKAACGARDNTDLTVQTSDEKKSNKKYLCMYCKKMYSKLPRHLEHVHRNEADVKKFSALPPGSN